MSAVEIVTHCRKMGITLAAKEGRLSVDAPKGALTPDLRQTLVDHKAEIMAELAANDGTTPADHPMQASAPATTLDATRAAFFSHMDACPVCRTSAQAALGCGEREELEHRYDVARIAAYGREDAHEGFSVVTTRAEEAARPATAAFDVSSMVSKAVSKAVSSAVSNMPKVVVTAAVRSEAWHRARDAYYSHVMTCQNCKPTGQCAVGEELEQEYRTLC